MHTEDLIPAREICAHYQVEISFIRELSAHELLEVKTSGEETFLEAGRLKDLERLISLHYEMDINLEGIEVVERLVRQLEEARMRMRTLEDRLGLYE